jgi:hypothetical protein
VGKAEAGTFPAAGEDVRAALLAQIASSNVDLKPIPKSYAYQQKGRKKQGGGTRA